METVGDLDHRSRWFGLRFVNGDTERQYREWRTDAATPFARIGYIGSIPSWTLLLIAFVTLAPETASASVPLISAWIVLLVALTVMTFQKKLSRAVMPLAAAANCIAGFVVVVLLFEIIDPEVGAQSRAGLMTAGVLIVMFFGFAIFRIPPGLAMVGVTPYLAFATWLLYDGYVDDELGAIDASGLAAAQWIAYFGCLLVCIVIEIVTRRTFTKDQIIGAQQQELHRSRDAIRRYVPPSVAEHIVLGDLAGVDVPARRRVTVMFSDLVGFTYVADRVEAEVLTQVVNEHMSAMSQIVHEHNGTVNEFAGDGLMALFGAPDELSPEDQVLSAVRAAQAMQSRQPSLNEAWTRLGVTEPLGMRIGINTGVLSVGSFGSAGRMTYTAIGLQTNVASRIQSHCEPGEILLSDASWHLIKDQITCEPRGEVVCKGVHYPVRIHAPLLGS